MRKDRTNPFLSLWYAHPRIAILLSLIGINLVVILVFTVILTLISGNAFLDELAYIFTYTMCSDGIYDFVNSQEDLACFVVKLLLTVLQMIIFSGALIGFSTDFLQTTIDKRLNNLGKIRLSGHYVLLNWSSIGANVVYDLSFLDGNKSVVILCENDREDVINSIQNIFLENKKKIRNLRIFVKKGNPSSLKHLDDVSLSKASYVGVLLANNNATIAEEMSVNDLSSLKTLLNIVSITSSANIVVETESKQTVDKIEHLLDAIDPALNKRIIAFSHNNVLGHIVGRSVINPLFSHLYHHLLSYDGCEFYGIAPTDVEQALYRYNDCIPVINYDDDDEIDERGNKNANHLYLLSGDAKHLGRRDTPRSYARPLPFAPTDLCEDFTLFILSDSASVHSVLEEVDNYNRSCGAHINVVSHSYRENLNEIIDTIGRTAGKKKILLLSSETDDVQTQDTDIFLSALALKLGGCLNSELEVLAEIVNPSNFNSLRNFGVMSVIVSNKIISLFMVQLLTHPGSKKFYRDLISTNSAEGDCIDLDIVTASKLLRFDEPEIHFSCKSELVQSFYLASDKRYMCIGVRPYSAPAHEILFLCDAMDDELDLTLHPDDELVVVKY